MAAHSHRMVPLRRRLLLLALVGIVPLAATSGLGLYAVVGQHRDEAMQSGKAVTRALRTLMDVVPPRPARGSRRRTA